MALRTRLFTSLMVLASGAALAQNVATPAPVGSGTGMVTTPAPAGATTPAVTGTAPALTVPGSPSPLTSGTPILNGTGGAGLNPASPNSVSLGNTGLGGNRQALNADGTPVVNPGQNAQQAQQSFQSVATGQQNPALGMTSPSPDGRIIDAGRPRGPEPLNAVAPTSVNPQTAIPNAGGLQSPTVFPQTPAVTAPPAAAPPGNGNAFGPGAMGSGFGPGSTGTGFGPGSQPTAPTQQ